MIGQCLMMIEVDWSLGPCGLVVLAHALSACVVVVYLGLEDNSINSLKSQ